MRTRITLVAALTAILGSPATAHAQDPCSRTMSRADSDTADILHPGYFVRVDEVPGEGDTIRHVFSPRSELSRRRRVHPVAEIDRNSTLRITFARGWMAQQPEFEAQLQIDGSLNGKPFEVPAYSMVGKEAGPGVVSVRAGREIMGLLCPVASALALYSTDLARVDTAIMVAQNRAASAAATRLLVDSVRQADQTRKLLIESLPTRTTATDSALVADSATVLEASMARYRANPSYQRVLNEYTTTAIPQLRTAFTDFRSTIDVLTQPGNAILVDLLARPSNMHGAQVVAIANRLKTSGIDTLTVASGHEKIEEVQRGLELIRDVLLNYRNYLTNNGFRSDPALLRRLKDTEIILSGLDVNPGDRVTLSFTNSLDSAGRNRRLDVPMRITRFGWVREINDSFLFLRRRHASYSRNPSEVEALRATVKAGEPREVDIPVGVNYALVPGASLTWSHRARSHRTLWHWLQPGAGLQVAFPKFETRTYTVTRSAEGVEPSVKEETRGNAFDIAVGGIVTLFDNALGVSVGRDMMVHDRPYYTAFSVSFVSLAKRAAQLLPTSQ